MLSIRKTALAAALSLLALGLTLDAARAGDGRRTNRAQAHQGADIKVFHKTSYRRRHKAGRYAKVGRRHGYRRWRGNPRRWTPPRRVTRKTRTYHRSDRRRVTRKTRKYRRWDQRRWSPPRRHYRKYRKTRRWDRRRYYRHQHRYWRPHRHGGDNALFGTVIGAALGAIIGDSVSQGHGKAAVIVGGAVVGGIIGNRVGRSMDAADQHHVTVVLETSRTGRPVEWSNIDNGNRYTMTPTRTYRNARGEDCRDYTLWGWVDGYEEKLHGTACRAEDGNWRTVT